MQSIPHLGVNMIFVKLDQVMLHLKLLLISIEYPLFYGLPVSTITFLGPNLWCYLQLLFQLLTIVQLSWLFQFLSLSKLTLHFCAFTSLVCPADSLSSQSCLLFSVKIKWWEMSSNPHLGHLCYSVSSTLSYFIFFSIFVSIWFLFITYLHLPFKFYERRGLICLTHCFIPSIKNKTCNILYAQWIFAELQM